MQIYKPHLHLQLTSSGDPQTLSIVVKMPAEASIATTATESVSGDTRTFLYPIITTSDPTAHQVERTRAFEANKIDLDTEKKFLVLIGDPDSGGGTKGKVKVPIEDGDPI